MHEDAHLEMMFEDRQGPWVDDDPDAGYFDEDGCPACGEDSDFCPGHGEIGDPAGYAILQAHDRGDHSDCHDSSSCRDEWLP